MSLTVETWCSTCRLRATWLVGQGGRFQIRDHESGFVCDHWREHHDALGRAAVVSSGRARVAPVAAEVVP